MQELNFTAMKACHMLLPPPPPSPHTRILNPAPPNWGALPPTDKTPMDKQQSATAVVNVDVYTFNQMRLCYHPFCCYRSTKIQFLDNLYLIE